MRGGYRLIFLCACAPGRRSQSYFGGGGLKRYGAQACSWRALRETAFSRIKGIKGKLTGMKGMKGIQQNNIDFVLSSPESPSSL